MPNSTAAKRFGSSNLTPLRAESEARITWVDLAKGYGIVLVVLAHAFRGLLNNDIGDWTPTTRFFDAWIYACHMPLFFLVSGLLLPRSIEKPWRVFISDKVRTIAYPYFIWSVIMVLIKAALGPLTTNPYRLSDLPLIFYAPLDQYWFLYVLFIFLIMTSALLKSGMSPGVIFVLAILIYPGILPIASYDWSVLAEIRGMAIYFALGVLIGSRQDFRMISAIPRGWLILAVLVGLFVASLAGFHEFPNRDEFLPIFALSGIAAVVAFSILTNKAAFGTAFQLLGRYSLEIYLVHTIASAGVRIVLIKFATITAFSTHFILGTLAGIYIPIILALFFERIGFRFAFRLPSFTPSNPAFKSAWPKIG